LALSVSLAYPDQKIAGMPSAVQNAVSLIFIHDVTESCSEADRGLQTVCAFSFRREIGNKNTEGFFFFGIYGRERCGQSPVFDLSGFYCFIEHDIFGTVRGRISVIPGSAGNHKYSIQISCFILIHRFYADSDRIKTPEG
jgi:hypothetical protein